MSILECGVPRSASTDATTKVPRRSDGVAPTLLTNVVKTANRGPEHSTSHEFAISPLAGWTCSLVAAPTPTTKIYRPGRWQFLHKPNPCYIPRVINLTVVIENKTHYQDNSTRTLSRFS